MVSHVSREVFIIHAAILFINISIYLEVRFIRERNFFEKNQHQLLSALTPNERKLVTFHGLGASILEWNVFYMRVDSNPYAKCAKVAIRKAQTLQATANWYFQVFLFYILGWRHVTMMQKIFSISYSCTMSRIVHSIEQQWNGP